MCIVFGMKARRKESRGLEMEKIGCYSASDDGLQSQHIHTAGVEGSHICGGEKIRPLALPPDFLL